MADKGGRNNIHSEDNANSTREQRNRKPLYF
jgi:hypothetical protein